MRPLGGMALLHVAANGLLLWLGYYWLGTGESRASALAWSAFIALAAVTFGCWSYGSTLVYFHEASQRRPFAAWRTTLRHLLPLTLAAILIGVIYWLLERWAVFSSKPAFEIASFLTMKFRAPVRPASIARIFGVTLWIVQWMVLPVLLLPAVSAIAAHGWRGYGAIAGNVRRWLYWIETPALLLVAFWIPLKLIGWVPRLNGFGLQAASFVLRAAVAYLLLVGGWLVLASVTSAGRPRFTQPNTVDSP